MKWNNSNSSWGVPACKVLAVHRARGVGSLDLLQCTGGTQSTGSGVNGPATMHWRYTERGEWGHWICYNALVVHRARGVGSLDLLQCTGGTQSAGSGVIGPATMHWRYTERGEWGQWICYNALAVQKSAASGVIGSATMHWWHTERGEWGHWICYNALVVHRARGVGSLD